jgi:hypothetical protein
MDSVAERMRTGSIILRRISGFALVLTQRGSRDDRKKAMTRHTVDALAFFVIGAGDQ